MYMTWSTKNKPYRDCSLWYRGCYAIGWAIEGCPGKGILDNPHIYTHYSGYNTNTKRQMWSISWGNLDGTSPAGPATDSGLHDDLRWQNEQQHDYGPAWKPTGRDLPQETKQLHLFNGKSGDQKIVCFRDFQWFPY